MTPCVRSSTSMCCVYFLMIILMHHQMSFGIFFPAAQCLLSQRRGPNWETPAIGNKHNLRQRAVCVFFVLFLLPSLRPEQTLSSRWLRVIWRAKNGGAVGNTATCSSPSQHDVPAYVFWRASQTPCIEFCTWPAFPQSAPFGNIINDRSDIHSEDE